MPMDRSAKSKVYSQLGAVPATTYEKSSGSVYMSVNIRKKIIDGEEKVMYSMCPNGSPEVAFTDLSKFLTSLKGVVEEKATTL